MNYSQFYTVVRSTKEIMNKALFGTKQNYTPMNKKICKEIILWLN